MPKSYKPQLNEVGSVWLEPSAEMARELSANKENVLGKLGFYCAHGRPEDFDGKFAKQVQTHEEEILSEIVGVLPRYSCPYRKSNPYVLMVQSTKDGPHLDAPSVLNDPSKGRILA